MLRKIFLAAIRRGGEQKVELAAGRAGRRQLQTPEQRCPRDGAKEGESA